MPQRVAPREFVPIRLPWGRYMEPSPCARETACYREELLSDSEKSGYHADFKRAGASVHRARDVAMHLGCPCLLPTSSTMTHRDAAPIRVWRSITLANLATFLLMPGEPFDEDCAHEVGSRHLLIDRRVIDGVFQPPRDGHRARLSPFAWRSPSGFPLPGQRFAIVPRLFAYHPRTPICEKSEPENAVY